MASNVRAPGTQLTINDLSMVQDALTPIAYKYIIFGSKINIEHHVLAGIGMSNYDFDDKLYKVLGYRLRQLPLLTWHDIVRALRSPAVYEQVLASQIESQYIPCSSSQSQPVSDLSSAIDPSSGTNPLVDMQHQNFLQQCHINASASVSGAILHSQDHPSSSPFHQSYHSPHHLALQMCQFSGSGQSSTPNNLALIHTQPPATQALQQHTLSHQHPPCGTVTGKRSHSQLLADSLQAPSSPTHDLNPFQTNPLHVQTSIGATNLAKRLHLQPEAVGPHSYNDTRALFKQFIERVKALYRSSAIEKHTEVLKLQTAGDVFINFACIDRKTEGLRTEYNEITEAMVRDGNVDVIEGRKCHIDMNKISADLPAEALEKVIIVEGAPGVGKSTFAWEFCRRWERGEIAQQYDLVLLLRLRDDSISKAKCLKDLIYHPSEKVCEAVVSELESCLGANVLLLLEGYDELPDECRCRPSFFLELINGQVLPFATLLITSRPWATSDVMKNFSHRIHQHIEVLGFTKRQIKSYIHRSLPQKEASELEDYLLKHSQIQMCMYIPLNSAIVVTVYKERKNALPKTLTELYSTLARTILLRYLRSKDTSAKVLASFDELPSNEHSIFCDLCELAYNSIAGDQVKLIFTDLPADFDSLGFMDSVFEFYVTRKEVASHNFLHLTLQEFLAAVHISGMEPNTRVEHFNRCSEGKLRVVLRFLAGLTHLKDFNSPSDFINVMDDPDNTGDTVIDYSVSTQLSWVYEAQRGDIVRDAFQENDTIEFKCEDQFDSSALGYCVANSRCKWVLSIGRAIDEDDASIFVEEAKRTHGTGGQIIGVRGKRSDDGDLESLIISLDGLNIMFKELKMYLQELAVILPAECI